MMRSICDNRIRTLTDERALKPHIAELDDNEIIVKHPVDARFIGDICGR
jgi:hypothetical protein